MTFGRSTGLKSFIAYTSNGQNLYSQKEQTRRPPKFLAFFAFFLQFFAVFIAIYRILVFWYSIQTGFFFVDMSGFAFLFKTASFWPPEKQHPHNQIQPVCAGAKPAPKDNLGFISLDEPLPNMQPPQALAVVDPVLGVFKPPIQKSNQASSQIKGSKIIQIKPQIKSECQNIVKSSHK